MEEAHACKANPIPKRELNQNDGTPPVSRIWAGTAGSHRPGFWGSVLRAKKWHRPGWGAMEADSFGPAKTLPVTPDSRGAFPDPYSLQGSFRFLERTMVEQNRESTPRLILRQPSLDPEITGDQLLRTLNVVACSMLVEQCF